MTSASPVVTILDRIKRAEELSYRARIILDLWKGVTLDTAVAPYENALEEFHDFWRFTRAAYETTFLIRISNLFTQHPESENFPSLIRAAQDADVISSTDAEGAWAILHRFADVAKRAKLVRDKAMAHQSRVLSQSEAFGKAQLSLNLMTELSDAALEVAGILVDATGLRRRVFHANPSASLRELMSFIESRLSSD